MILSPKIMGELLFDLEKYFFSQSSTVFMRGKSIFICGLARAGTTILMRSIYETNEFASLTYEDMPLVIAPNIWAKISMRWRKTIEESERAHGDRIKVSFKSPEAFEEVFWRTTNETKFTEGNGILSYSPSQESLQQFKNYLALVCLKYNKGRYLSKNNNNIFRLLALSRFCKDDIFLIPFRHPLSHAQSLLNQHRRFSNPSSFEADYMRWLGHFEFGETHKHFLFDNTENYITSTASLEYWIDVWIKTYKTILNIVENGATNLIPVCYEMLCENDQQYFAALSKKCELTNFSPTLIGSSTVPSGKIGSEKLNIAQLLYDKLCGISDKILL